MKNGELLTRVLAGTVTGGVLSLFLSAYAVLKFVLNIGTIEGRGLGHLATIVVGYLLGGLAAGAFGGAFIPLRRTLPGALTVGIGIASIFVMGIAVTDAGFHLADVDALGMLGISLVLGSAAGVVIWKDARREGQARRGQAPSP